MSTSTNPKTQTRRIAEKAQKLDPKKVIGTFVRNLEKLGAKAKAGR